MIFGIVIRCRETQPRNKMLRATMIIGLFLFCLLRHAPAHAYVLQSSDFDRISGLSLKASDLLRKLTLSNTAKFAQEKPLDRNGNSDLVQWTLCVNQLRSVVSDVAAMGQFVSTEIAISQKMKQLEDEATALSFVQIGLSDFGTGLTKWRDITREAGRYCGSDTMFKTNVEELLNLLDQVESSITPLQARISSSQAGINKMP
jgi:hypothetical protein